MFHPTDAADDLDAFFDEVEEQVDAVEAGEGKVEQEEENENAVQNGHYEKFLEEDADVVHPPTKKIKPTIVPPPIPKGVVVASAAAAAATSTVATNSSSSSTTNTVPYPVLPSTHHYGMVPPPPPPLQQFNTIGHTMTGTNHPVTMAVPSSSTGTHVHSATTAATTTIATTTNTTTKGNNSKPHIRSVAGKVWVDPSLSDWPDDDFRIFVGNLDPTVTDQQLYDHFAPHYPSLHQVRIIRDKKKNQTSLGYGFCSLLDPLECARAIREQDQTWLGGRPIRIKRSHWKDRELSTSQPSRNTKATKKRR